MTAEEIGRIAQAAYDAAYQEAWQAGKSAHQCEQIAAAAAAAATEGLE